MIKKTLLIAFSTILFYTPISSASQSVNSSDNLDTTYDCENMQCKKLYRQLKNYARNGSHVAKVMVAVAYLTGNGFEKDISKGILVLHQASAAGSGRAAWMLSHYYKTGLYVDKSDEQSAHYLGLALERKFKGALFEKAVSTLDLNGKENNSAEIEMLLLAEQQNSLPAKYLVAKLYETGTVLPLDLVAAATRYSSLAQKGYRDSEQRFHEVLQLAKEGNNKSNYDVINNLNEDIEVINVTGNKYTLTNKLSYIVNSLESSGLYYKSATSRIRGKTCANSSSGCVFIDDPKKWLRGF